MEDEDRKERRALAKDLEKTLKYAVSLFLFTPKHVPELLPSPVIIFVFLIPRRFTLLGG